MKLLKKSRGFTLLEVLIVAVILSVMSFAIFAIMNVANLNYTNDLGLLNLHQQARMGMEWIVKEARQASFVNITNSSSVSINTPAATDIRYYLSNNALVRRDPNGVTKTIAHNISGLTFSHINKMFTVSITSSNTVMRTPLSFSLKQIVRLRNE